MRLIADLHAHSCLSPCGDLEMSPRAMAARAREQGTDIIALTDHNSVRNCPAMAVACQREGLVFFPGMEAQPREEVHVLCLFPSVERAMTFGARAEAFLGCFPNDPDRLGDQIWVDDDEFILGSVESYLGQSLDLSLDDLCELVLEHGGILIPAHIDRSSQSMKTSLGFLPPGPWVAVESRRVPPDGIDPAGYPVIVASDAHHLADLGRRRIAVDLDTDWKGMEPEERMGAFARALRGPSLEILFRS